MRLTKIERDFLERLLARKELLPFDDIQYSARQRMRRMGYAFTEKQKWAITSAGIAALVWEPPAGDELLWRDMTPAQQHEALTNFIAKWCEDRGENYDALCVAARSKARQALCIDIKLRFPDVGPSRVSLYLGGLDHTTVYHAWKKLGVQTKGSVQKKKTRPKTERDREANKRDREFIRQRRQAIREEALKRLKGQEKRVIMRMP